MEREIRYCTTRDGVHIAYAVEGSGPEIVVCPGFIESFSLDHLIPEEEAFMERLGTGRRVIRYDMRGTGVSQREVEDLSHSALLLDLDAVIDASGAENPCLWASTISGPRAIEYAASHPERLRGLILYGTMARGTDVMPPAVLHAMAQFILASHDLAIQTLVGSNLTHGAAEPVRNMARVYKESATADVVSRLLLSGYDNTDVGPLLAQLNIPTLVVHRINDGLIPFALGQALASAIPNARFAALEGSVHPFAFGETEPVIEAVEAFLRDIGATAPAAGQEAGVPSVVTVLFTDIVGHTEMMRRLGDNRGREILREHERITRETLKPHGGAELKTMGDGFMASFGSVSAAMECAVALQQAFSERNESALEPLHIRVGLDAGEPIAEDGDLFGSTVILAARIAAQAEAGEILIAEPVRHLLSGKGFVFADRGERLLKGFEDAVRLYEVRWGR